MPDVRQRTARASAGGGATAIDVEVSELRAALAAARQEREEAEQRAEEAAAAELRVIEESLEREARYEAERERLSRLEGENAALKWNLKAMGSGAAITESDDDEEVSSETVESWDDMKKALPSLDGPGFKLSERALNCADGKSRYPDPDVLWKALVALERVGRAYNELSGRTGGQRFEQFALEQAGLTIALTDNTYSDCWFEYEGEWHRRLPHVKVDDAKSPNAVGRIYFAMHSAENRLIVDWFGTKPDRPNTKRAG